MKNGIVAEAVKPDVASELSDAKWTNKWLFFALF
jgi:hypothetical protein